MRSRTRSREKTETYSILGRVSDVLDAPYQSLTRSCLVSYDSSFLASDAKSFDKIGLALQQLWPINACLCLHTFYAPNLHPTSIFHRAST